jgi:chromosomal replication initiator protein
VPTRFLKSWIDQNYRERLLALWEEERDDVRRVELSIRGAGAGAKPAIAAVIEPAVRRSGPAAPPPVVLAAGAAAAARAGSDDQFGSPIDKRLTFDSFMVGRANELAHKAAVEIASSAEPLPYNPLYLHGSVGLGKSHLLHAIAHAGRASGRRVVYLTAERFMYGFVQALKAQSAIAFKETLRGIDILLIDDLQFLQGKHMQAEFGHTLNALLDGSRQVVVAADRPPSELETADERMKSRLGGGLVLEIAPPDLELRRKILRAKIDASRERYPDLAVPEAVIAYVAHAVEASGRDLDGAFNRLVAHNQFAAEPLSVEMAEDCLKDLIRTREPKRVKIEDIQRIVAKHHGVSRQDLVSARRTRNVVVPRQVAMYLAKVLTPRSLPEIGRRFGGRCTRSARSTSWSRPTSGSRRRSNCCGACCSTPEPGEGARARGALALTFASGHIACPGRPPGRSSRRDRSPCASPWSGPLSSSRSRTCIGSSSAGTPFRSSPTC